MNLQNTKLFYSLFALILIAGILIRLDVFQYPHYHYQGDFARDYLVAHHTVKYGEIPLNGPDGGVGSFVSSPIYFYFLSAWLTLNDSIVSLGLFNVFLQIITIIAVFLLAKNLFGNRTALIATTLFTFSQALVHQSAFVWQPYVMQPFVNISYLFLFLAYRRSNFFFLLTSIVMFIFAIILHNSVLGVAPFFFFLIFVLLWHQKRRFFHYGVVIFASAGTILLFNFPVFLKMWQNELPENLSFAPLRPLISQSPLVALETLPARFLSFFKFFFVNNGDLSAAVFGVILLAGVILYLSFQPSPERKRYLGLLFLGILAFIFISTYRIVLYHGIPFPVRYFTPIMGLFIILLAEIISLSFLQKKLVAGAATVILLSALIGMFAPGITRYTPGTSLMSIYDPTHSESSRENRFFDFAYISPPGIAEVKREILTIRQEEGRENLNFFDFVTFNFVPDGMLLEDLYANEVFWVPLERELGTKLTEVSDASLRGWKPLGEGIYIFLRCAGTDKECLVAFSDKYPSYTPVKNIYSSEHGPQIFLFKRMAT